MLTCAATLFFALAYSEHDAFFFFAAFIFLFRRIPSLFYFIIIIIFFDCRGERSRKLHPAAAAFAPMPAEKRKSVRIPEGETASDLISDLTHSREKLEI